MSTAASSLPTVTRTRKEIAALSLGALGVVYGDIGTSPLYAMRECFGATNPHHTDAAFANNVLGVLSLVFWSLTMVVTVKYLTFVMRADNQGAGGILALLALVPPKNGKRDGRPIAKESQLSPCRTGP